MTSAQRFVNNPLTNQPVPLQHLDSRETSWDHLYDEQYADVYQRPGKLEEKVSFDISSTDPTKPALLEEIAQMRVGSVQPVAELLVEFADVTQDESLGTNISRDAEFYAMPAKKTIPNLPRSRLELEYPYSLNARNRTNGDFYRELADFVFIRRLFRPIRLVVRNVGQVAANNVRVELTVPTNADVRVMYASALPDPPKRHAYPWDNAIMKSIRPASRRNPGEVRIDKNDERFRVEIDCGNLQPGRRVWSDASTSARE
jgi:hypothetical protein